MDEASLEIQYFYSSLPPEFVQSLFPFELDRELFKLLDHSDYRTSVLSEEPVSETAETGGVMYVSVPRTPSFGVGLPICARPLSSTRRFDLQRIGATNHPCSFARQVCK